METQWIIAGLVIGAVIGVIILKAMGGSKDANQLRVDSGNAAPSQSRALTEEQLTRLRELYKAGEKIQAIKEYRDITKCGLKEAKDAVESNFTQITPKPLAPSGDALEEIKSLMKSGEKIQAIKRYREVYGVGLAEAKYAVENLPLD